MGWSARLLVALVLILAGAAATVWGVAHYQPAARFLGVAAVPPQPNGPTPQISGSGAPAAPPMTSQNAPPVAGDARVASLEQRVAAVEHATQRAEGSAGRADALVVAFAARRAIDRGVVLGYLETLLQERFGAQHQAAVATIITVSRRPVRLAELTSEYETLAPVLQRGGPQDNWWNDFKREMGSLIEVHRATRPAVNAEARYHRALQHLASGDVDQALAETMRLPGASGANDWATKARQYVAVHRALDEIESAALLPGSSAGR